MQCLVERNVRLHTRDPSEQAWTATGLSIADESRDTEQAASTRLSDWQCLDFCDVGWCVVICKAPSVDMEAIPDTLQFEPCRDSVEILLRSKLRTNAIEGRQTRTASRLTSLRRPAVPKQGVRRGHD